MGPVVSIINQLLKLYGRLTPEKFDSVRPSFKPLEEQLLINPQRLMQEYTRLDAFFLVVSSPGSVLGRLV